jgi:hypothetical protein
VPESNDEGTSWFWIIVYGIIIGFILMLGVALGVRGAQVLKKRHLEEAEVQQSGGDGQMRRTQSNRSKRSSVWRHSTVGLKPGDASLSESDPLHSLLHQSNQPSVGTDPPAASTIRGRGSVFQEPGSAPIAQTGYRERRASRMIGSDLQGIPHGSTGTGSTGTVPSIPLSMNPRGSMSPTPGQRQARAAKTGAPSRGRNREQKSKDEDASSSGLSDASDNADSSDKHSKAPSSEPTALKQDGSPKKDDRRSMIRPHASVTFDDQDEQQEYEGTPEESPENTSPAPRTSTHIRPERVNTAAPDVYDF